MRGLHGHLSSRFTPERAYDGFVSGQHVQSVVVPRVFSSHRNPPFRNLPFRRSFPLGVATHTVDVFPTSHPRGFAAGVAGGSHAHGAASARLVTNERRRRSASHDSDLASPLL